MATARVRRVRPLTLSQLRHRRAAILSVLDRHGLANAAADRLAGQLPDEASGRVLDGHVVEGTGAGAPSAGGTKDPGFADARAPRCRRGG